VGNTGKILAFREGGREGGGHSEVKWAPSIRGRCCVVLGKKIVIPNFLSFTKESRSSSTAT
jgi:hypothetical protein